MQVRKPSSEPTPACLLLPRQAGGDGPDGTPGATAPEITCSSGVACSYATGHDSTYHFPVVYYRWYPQPGGNGGRGCDGGANGANGAGGAGGAVNVSLLNTPPPVPLRSSAQVVGGKGGKQPLYGLAGAAGARAAGGGGGDGRSHGCPQHLSAASPRHAYLLQWLSTCPGPRHVGCRPCRLSHLREVDRPAGQF